MNQFNHICANPNCPNKIIGADGKPQPNYWACDDCDRGKGITYRSICCSEKCFNEYYDIISGKKQNPEPKSEPRTIKKRNKKSQNNSKPVETVEVKSINITESPQSTETTNNDIAQDCIEETTE